MRHPIILRPLYLPLREKKTAKVKNEVVPGQFAQKKDIDRALEKRMSWPELKLFMNVVANANDTNGLRYTQTLRELCKMLELGDYHSVKKDMESMLTNLNSRTILLWKGTSLYAFHLFDHVVYNTATDCVYLQLHSQLVPHLQDIQRNFTLVFLEEFNTLHSFGCGRLFILVCHCLNLDQPSLRTFSIVSLRKQCGTEEKLPNHRFLFNLRFWRTTIRRGTNIIFDLTFLKTGKKVTAVRIDNVRRRATNKQLA